MPLGEKLILYTLLIGVLLETMTNNVKQHALPLVYYTNVVFYVYLTVKFLYSLFMGSSGSGQLLCHNA